MAKPEEPTHITLTKREMISAMMLQSLITPTRVTGIAPTPKTVMPLRIQLAIEYADALIAELNKTP